MNPILSSTPNMPASSRHWSSTPYAQVSHSSPVSSHRRRHIRDPSDRRSHHTSDDDYDDSRFEDDDGLIQTSFNFDLAGASTPIRSSRATRFSHDPSSEIINASNNSDSNLDANSSSFFLPISKLHNFHLESEIDNEHEETVSRTGRFTAMSSPTPGSDGSLFAQIHLLPGSSTRVEDGSDDLQLVAHRELARSTDLENDDDDDEEEEEEEDDDDEAENAADKSFLNSSDVDEIPIKEDIAFIPPPIFINKRKRHLAESPPAADSTPIPANMTITPDNHKLFRKLAMESHKLPGEPITDRRNNTLTDLNISASSINSSVFKISFNDSTPCPSSPKRKKMRLMSGSATKVRVKGPVLDFSNCRKSSILDVDFQNQISNQNEHAQDDSLEQILETSPNQDKSANSSLMRPNNSFQSSPTSTPISQSTPDNSNPPTEERKKPNQLGPKRSPIKPHMQTVEYGQPINGYRYVTPLNNQRYLANPTTPLAFAAPVIGTTNDTSLHFNELLQLGDQRMIIDAESTSIYSRINDTNESNEYSHFINDINDNKEGLTSRIENGLDPRRNDPYLSSNFTKTVKKAIDIREEYDQLNKLPLLQVFESDSNFVPLKQQMWTWINDGESLVNFYNYIKHPDETIFGLIKSDRRRWHPDKWSDAKLQANELDAEIISLLSQMLNSIIDDLA